MLHGLTFHSPMPQDIPWYKPDHAVFFGVLYIVLGVLGAGMGYTVIKSWWQTRGQ